MANPIKPKRSFTANAVPTAADLATNELAINWTDGKAFTKNAAGQVVTLTLGGGGGSDPRWAYLAPAAPTGVTATAGNAQATVSWTAPTSVAPITDYVVQYSSNSGSSWTTFSDGTSTATSATVTGLTNGTSYIFRTAAVSGIGQGAWSSTDGDPYYSSVSMLLHGDGTLSDSSAYARAVTAIGSSAANATAKYGSGALSFPSDGSYLSVADSSNLELGGSNFTLEAWIYPTSYPTNSGGYYQSGLICKFIGGDYGYTWNITGTSSSFTGMSFQATDSSTPSDAPSFSVSGSFSLNQWAHVALVRSGNLLYFFKDGTLLNAGGTAFSLNIRDSSAPVLIGRQQFDNTYTYQFFGRMDEVRFTKAARYTSSFTPSTAAFENYGPPTATPTA